MDLYSDGFYHISSLQSVDLQNKHSLKFLNSLVLLFPN